MMVQITRALNCLSWFLTCRVTVQRWASPAFCPGLPGEGHASRTESQLSDPLAVCSYYQHFIPQTSLSELSKGCWWLGVWHGELDPGDFRVWARFSPWETQLETAVTLSGAFSVPHSCSYVKPHSPYRAHLSSYSSQHLHHHRTLESSQAGHGWCLFSAAYFPSQGRVVVEKHVPPLYSKGTGCNLDKTFVVIDKILHVDIFLDYWGVLKIRLTYAPLNPIHPERSVSSILGLIQELGIINGVSHFF